MGRTYPTDVFDSYVQGLDDRSATIFHAAPAGGLAFARLRIKASVFLDALLRGLEGRAGEELQQSDDGSHARWGVTVRSLARYLSTESQKVDG